MRYAVVIEQIEQRFGAFVPDLPGCVAVGGSIEEVQHLIREAIELPLGGMREDGVSIPEPRARCEYIEVPA